MTFPDTTFSTGTTITSYWLNAVNDALVNGADSIEYVPPYPNAVPTTVGDKLAQVANVKDFGAVGNGVTDDTAAINAAISYLKTSGVYNILYFPPGNYAVTQIVFDHRGLQVICDGAFILGIASSPTHSIVDIKEGLMYIQDLKVNANFNQNYDCCIHWYTNDINTYYPGKNRFHGIACYYGLIGMVIGALPNQPDPIPSQNDPVTWPDWYAQNAPLSESYVSDFFTEGCIKGLYVRQPNGKVHFMCPLLGADSATWPSPYNTTLASSTCALTVLASSEVSLYGGEMLSVWTAQGRTMTVDEGHVEFFGTGIEMLSPMYIYEGTVRFRGIQNGFGLNIQYPFIHVDENFSGVISFENTEISRGNGVWVSAKTPILSSLSDMDDWSAASPCENGLVQFSNCVINNAVFGEQSQYYPLVRDIRSSFKDCVFKQYDSNGTLVTFEKLDDHYDLLPQVLDSSLDTYPAYAANADGSYSGLTVTSSSPCTWGKVTGASLPPVLGGEPVVAAMRVTAPSGRTVTFKSAAFPVTPGKTYIFTGWVKYTGADGSPVTLGFEQYKYDGSTSSSTNVLGFNITAAATHLVKDEWELFSYKITVDSDTTKLKFVTVGDNQDFYFANLKLV